MEFRNISREDLPELAALFFRVYTVAPWFDRWSSVKEVEIYLGELLDNPHSRGFAAWEDGCLVGGCLGACRSWYSGREFNIIEFFVDTTCQGKGLGSGLMNFVKSELRNEPVQAITLLTQRDFPAVDFYRKHQLEIHEKMVFMAGQINS